MSPCEKLHDDPTVRALLWCLLSSGELHKDALRSSGFTDSEAHAILKDESGLLRRMKRRHALSQRLGVAELASLLRNRLSEHIEAAKQASELATLLRSLKGLPLWLFPEWERAQLEHNGGNSLDLLVASLPQRA